MEENIIKEVMVPAGHGGVIEVKAGQILKVMDVEGGQIADFFAYVMPEKKEYLSMAHTRYHLGRFYLKEGDTLVTNNHRPIMKLIEDTCGIHDMSFAACNPGYFSVKEGIKGKARSCRTNVLEVTSSYGISEWQIRDPLDLFQYSPAMVLLTSRDKPGTYVRFEMLLDALVAVSSCPYFEELHMKKSTPVLLTLTEKL